MTELAVIGIGSPHGADQLGWQVIDRLRQHPVIQALDPGMRVLHRCDRPGLSLLEYLRGTDTAILIDAVAGGTAGRLVRLNRDQLMVSPTAFSSHTAGVAEALALGETLRLLPAQLVLHGMETGDEGMAFVPTEESVVKLTNAIANEITM